MFDNAEENVLYRAILEAPFDDALRLIYADWQDEHGNNEFAEFIRLQIAEYAKTPTRGIITDIEHDMLYGGVGTGKGNTWFRPVKTAMHVERGFPSRVEFLSLAGWSNYGEEAVITHPVCRVSVRDRVPEPIENGKLVRWNYRSERFPESELPSFVFRMMTGHDRVPVVFANIEAADAALSLALLNVVRDLHDMPLLTREQLNG